jgi:hypothetical protein
MDKITQTNTARILKFLQAFKMDFNNYSIWNYSRKKFHFNETTRPLIDEAIEAMEASGLIEKVRRPGYYRLSVKGENFESWELEDVKDAQVAGSEKVQNSWKKWLMPSKNQEARV